MHSEFVDLITKMSTEQRAEQVIRELRLKTYDKESFHISRGFRTISKSRILDICSNHNLQMIALLHLVKSHMMSAPPYEPKVTVGDVLDELQAVVDFDKNVRKVDNTKYYRTSRHVDFFKELYYIGTSGDSKGWRHNLRITKFAGSYNDAIEAGDFYPDIPSFIVRMMKMVNVSLSENALHLYETRSGKSARDSFLFDYVQFMKNLRAPKTEQATVSAPTVFPETETEAQSTREQVETKTLPDLIGSGKQIAFAKKIRDIEHSKNPENTMLYEKCQASFWINFSGKLR